MKKIISLFSLALLTMSAWGANTYVKITSLDQLEVGKKYILVAEENSRAMGEITGTSTNYGSAVDITIDNGVIDIDGTDVVELTASEGQVTSNGPTWIFGLNDGYIIWTSGNSLNQINIAAGFSGAMWIPTVTDDGVVLKNNQDLTRKLQYNAGAPRFACYTSTQKPAVLYVQGEPEEEGITTLVQANALEDAAEFTFNGDAVVTACKNGYVFLRDESGYGMIAGVTGAAFENGQVLGQGWTATKTSVNSGWVRYTNAAGLSYSGENNAELAAPQELMTKPTDDSMLNAYVLIRNTTISSGGGGSFPGFPGHAVQYTLPDGTTIGETQTLWSFDGEAGSDLYNVYGIVCKVSGTYKIQPVIFEKIEEPQPTVDRGNVNGIGGVDMDDLTALINYLLDPTSTISFDNAAVCNSMDSNLVDMDDLTALINYLLTETWPD